MKTTSRVLVHLYQLSCFVFTLATASKVEFYESVNFVGLLVEMNATSECTNLPQTALAKSQSLSTDTCLLLYQGPDCTQNSIQVFQGSYPNLEINVTHQFRQHFGNSIQSYHACDPSTFTPRVTFYEESRKLAEYQDFCGCVTLPSSIDRATRLDNHNTCVGLYIEPHGIEPSCNGQAVELLGGTSYLSQDLRNLTHSSSSWKRLVAIGPCTQSLSRCTHLTATVTKFEVDTDPSTASTQSSTSAMSMAMTTSFKNNGTARIAEVYTATKSVEESSETKVTSSYFRMDNWTLETGVEAEFSADIPLAAKGAVSFSLQSAYNSVENSSKEESYVHRKSISTNFSVSQRIEIDACSVYNVNSFVKMVHNFPVNYKVYCKVSGKLGKRVLTAEEIKERLGELKWVKHEDDYTVLAVGEGQMSVDFGMETVINGEGYEITGCKTDNIRELGEEINGNAHSNQQKSQSQACSFNIHVLVGLFLLGICINVL